MQFFIKSEGSSILNVSILFLLLLFIYIIIYIIIINLKFYILCVNYIDKSNKVRKNFFINIFESKK